MATFRRWTGTPFTFLPRKTISPEVGSMRPAIICIRVVLPASVVPRRTLNESSCNSRFVSWICTSAPTRFVTLRSSRDMARQFRAYRCHSLLQSSSGALQFSSGAHHIGAPRKIVLYETLLVLRPALDELIVGDRLALGFLVIKLRPRRVIGAQPLGRIAGRV